MPDDEFYIGYKPNAPRYVAAPIRIIVAGLLVGLPLLAAIVAHAQRPLRSGVFEFGVYRTFEGTLFETPIPFLRVSRPTAQGEHAAENVLLVGFGKQGLPPFARGAHGNRIRFNGSLIYRTGTTMIEMNDPDSFAILGPAETHQHLGPAQSFGEVTLEGELVDTKCYLGVMRPGAGKGHRACAVHCLAGGIPPGVVVRAGDQSETLVLLTGTGGAELVYNPEWAGRTVQVRGVLEVRDGAVLLQAAAITLL